VGPPHSTLTKIFGKPTKPIDVTSDMIKIIQDKTEKLNENVKQRKGYELEPMTTVDIERKYDPRKKYDRVSAYEQGEIIGREKVIMLFVMVLRLIKFQDGS
jgi:hypothetical protein